MSDIILADSIIIAILTFVIYNCFGYNQPIYGGADASYKIITFAKSNSSGLAVDSNVFKNILNSNAIYTDRENVPMCDILIHLENILPGASAKYHVWVPNQEFISDWDIKNKDTMDLILCKTHETSKVIKELYTHSTKSPKIIYTGFTSTPTQIKARMPRDEKVVLLLAAQSVMKNVDLILKYWLENDCFREKCAGCKLIVSYFGLFNNTGKRYKKINHDISNSIKKYVSTAAYTSYKKEITNNKMVSIEGTNITIYEKIPDELYNHLIKTSGISICCSANEGFGHYLNEAKYYGTIPLTTNAPPMNELITDRNLLVKSYIRGKISDLDGRNYMFSKRDAPAYGVDAADFAAKFIALYNSDKKQQIRDKLRKSFELGDTTAKNNITDAISGVKLHAKTTTLLCD
jgi:hypothetical protein